PSREFPARQFWQGLLIGHGERTIVRRTHSDPEAEGQQIDLARAAQLLLEECRMVLPGLQALFGFQLVAVFNSRFSEALSHSEQKLHLLAVALSAVSIAFIMTPAALHRQKGPRKVTSTFIRLSTRLLLISMFPLASSICVDLYIVASVVLG